MSDGMPNSNSIINHYSPISLAYKPVIVTISYEWRWRKKDLINQSSISFILFIINSFDSTVSSSPSRAPHPRMMDCSWFRSHSSFIQSFILSNTIELQKQNGPYPISIMLREGRLVTLNDMLPLPTHPWITICLTELVMSCIWSILDIQNTERCWDSKCLEGKTTLFIVTTYSRASSIVHHTDQSYLYNSILLYYQMVLSSEFHLK